MTGRHVVAGAVGDGQDDGRLRLEGLSVAEIARRQEMFGRIMRGRALELEERGLIGRGQRYEDLVMIRAERQK